MSLVSTDISSMQVKLMYLHFKTIKVNESIERINDLKFDNPKTPEAIASKGNLIYDVIDVIIMFESYHSLVDELIRNRLLSSKFNVELKRELQNVRKVMSQWKHVRNKIGGHLDLTVIEEFCKKYNYNGVFISENLEADFKGVLLLMMLETAINSTNEKSNLFEEDLVLTKPLGLNKFNKKFMDDWLLCLNLFESIQEFFYSIGRSEKMKFISKENVGIIKF